jgi:hypothetical protein
MSSDDRLPSPRRRRASRAWSGAAAVAGLAAFVLLATANSAGYRYGASDQAFYLPAILERIDPTLFPRDSALIHAQARLTNMDEVIGAVALATGAPLHAIFAVLQVVTLGLLALAGWRLATIMYRTEWARYALIAALTLRHAIPRSGTNTLEGYFHPRQLAFALGALAAGDWLRGRYYTALLLVLMAAALHPTTALWFAIWLGVSTFVAEPGLRRPLAILGAVSGSVALWALYGGPFAGRLVRMDPAWLDTLASKDYLFPLRWPAFAWLINLGYIPVIAWAYRRRRAAGLTVPREAALVAGCLSLAAVFAVAVPLNGAHVALAIQLQPARMFWMLDLVAIVYVVWACAEGSVPSPARARAVAIVLALLSLSRGAYIMRVEFPDRALAQLALSDDDWGRAMAWARTTERGSGWLADPGHAARYGTSLRVAGNRDVFVEEIKDSAIGMYDRGVALRTRERVAALGDFTALTADRARTLGREYGLDYLVTEQKLELPVVFRSGALAIYSLR